MQAHDRGPRARFALARHRARIGLVEEVVVEGPSKKNPRMTSGRTAQNKLVHFAAPSPLRGNRL